MGNGEWGMGNGEWQKLSALNTSQPTNKQLSRRALPIPTPDSRFPALQGFGPCPSLSSQCSTRRVTKR
ncbi:hypothetical protein FMO13_06375 [Xanthomonas phaseoli pv. dieffenbachiae]